MEREWGFKAIKHQRFVGAGYFDQVQQTVAGGEVATVGAQGLHGRGAVRQALTPGYQGLTAAPRETGAPFFSARRRHAAAFPFSPSESRVLAATRAVLGEGAARYISSSTRSTSGRSPFMKRRTARLTNGCVFDGKAAISARNAASASSTRFIRASASPRRNSRL